MAELDGASTSAAGGRGSAQGGFMLGTGAGLPLGEALSGSLHSGSFGSDRTPTRPPHSLSPAPPPPLVNGTAGTTLMPLSAFDRDTPSAFCYAPVGAPAAPAAEPVFSPLYASTSDDPLREDATQATAGASRLQWQPPTQVFPIAELPERSSHDAVYAKPEIWPAELPAEAEPSESEGGHSGHCFGHYHYPRARVPEFEFAVEVSSGPPNSCFRHTKVLHIKDKYIVHNTTGLPLEVRDRASVLAPRVPGQRAVTVLSHRACAG